MKRNNNILWIALLSLLLLPASISANDITIGNGTYTTRYFPWGYYYYNYNQMIYTAAEIGQAGGITTLQFHYTGYQSYTVTDLVIYMGHTSKTGFTSGTDWESYENLTQVYSGSISLNAGSAYWVSIELDNAFSYNGTDNLLIAFDKNDPVYASSSYWYSTYTYVSPDYNSKTIYCRSSSTNINPASPASGNIDYYRPNVVLSLSEEPMAFASTTTETASEDNVYLGAADNEVIRLNVATTGYVSALPVTSITFNTTGTSNVNDITQARVYVTSNANFSTSTPFGDAVINPSGSFTVTGNQSLVGGNNYFWLTYDIDGGATLANVVDAQCTSVTVDGIAYTPTVTDPAGSRSVADPIAAATTETASTGDAYLGTTNNEIIRLKVVNAAPAGVVSATAVTFGTEGTTQPSDIANARVYYTTAATFSTAVPFGSAVVSPSGSFEVTGTQLLANGDNYFWLAYDVLELATVGNTLDGVCTAFAIEGVSFNPDVTAPSGSRTVADPITSVTTETASTLPAYLGTANNEIVRLHIVNVAPSNAINATSFTFNTSGTSSPSDLTNARIFYTTSTSFSTSVIFGSVVATPSGSFTVNGTKALANGDNYFWLAYDVASGASLGNIVDGQCTSITAAGLAKTPTETNPTGSRTIANPFSLITTQTASTNPVYRNTANNAVIKVEISMDAASGSLNATSFTFNTNGSTNEADLTEATVYYTTANAFSTATTFGSPVSTPSGSYIVNGSQSLANGSNYFWLAYDISAAAPTGNVVDAQCTSVTAGGNVHPPTATSPPGSRTVGDDPVNLTATAGTLTGTYANLKLAFDKINDGTHQGAIAITLTGNTEETAVAQLYDPNYGSADYSSISIMPDGGDRIVMGDISTYLIDFIGADNVTINGLNDGTNSLTFINTNTVETSSGYGKVLNLYGYVTNGYTAGAVDNITIQNCTIKGNISNSPYIGISGYYGVNDVIIKGCTIEPYGSNYTSQMVYAYGDSPSAPKIQNLSMINNRIRDYGGGSAYSSYGINIKYVDGGSFAGNRFYQTSTKTFDYAGDTFMSAMYFYGCRNLAITGNIIGYANENGTGESTLLFAPESGYDYKYVYGIFNYQYSNAPIYIANNTIAGIRVSCSSESATRVIASGIRLESSTSSSNAAYTVINNTIGSLTDANSIVIDSKGGYSSFSGIDARTSSYIPRISTGDFNNNIIAGINTGAIQNPASGGISGMNVSAYTGSSPTINVNNNIIGSPEAPLQMGYSTYTTATSIVGISMSEAIVPYSIRGNIVQNLVHYSNNDGSGYYTCGIKDPMNGSTYYHREVSDNIVRNITSEGGIRGIFFNNSGNYDVDIEHNEVYNLTAGNGIHGISYPGKSGVIKNNFVYRLKSTNAASMVAGIYFFYNPISPLNLALNNIIVLGQDAQAENIGDGFFVGLYDGSYSASYYYNTVVLLGEATTGSNNTYAFYRSNTSTNGGSVIKNNVFYNGRTNNGGSGIHYGIRVGSASSLTIDFNNYYYTEDGKIAEVYNPYTWFGINDLDALRLYTGQDLNSAGLDPSFANAGGTSPNDYLMSTTLTGTPVTDIVTVDYFDDIRSVTTPSMGAIETGGVFWSGAVSNDWNTPGNWASNSVPLLTESVVIQEGLVTYPVIQSGVQASCNNLTVNNGASLAMLSGGSLLTQGAIRNAGSITISRSMTDGIWHYIGVPVSNATANTFLGDYLGYWNEPAALWGEIIEPATVLMPMKGYSLWGVAKSTTHTFTGTPNTGAQSIPVTFTQNNTNYEGYNLVSNPYPSSLDWSLLDDTYGAIYYWNGSQYASWVNGTQTNGGVQYVPPMQGFFIHTSVNTSFSLNNNHRTHEGATGFFKGAALEGESIKLLCSAGDYTDEWLLLFNNNTQEGFELTKDARKMSVDIAGVPELSSITPDGRLSIDCRPQSNLVQLGYSNDQAGTHSILLKESAGITTAYLEDTQTNLFHDLNTGAYSFYWDPISDSETRFRLHLNAVGVEESMEQGQCIKVYSAGQALFIQGAENGSVWLTDLSGKVVMEKQVADQNLTCIRVNLNPGIYIVSVLTQNNLVTRKVLFND